MELRNYIAEISIPGGQTYATEFYVDGFELKEVYYDDLEPADNSCRIRIPFDEILSDDLKLNVDKDIKVKILDSTLVVFSGYLRKTFTFEKQQRHQPISLEVVSPSFLLKVELDEGIVLIDNSVEDICKVLLSKVGFTIKSPTDSGKVLNFPVGSVPCFLAEEGENVYDILSELLFEFGHTFDFDEYGDFIVYGLFTTNTEIETIERHFNGYNVVGSLKQQIKENTYNNITTNWSTVQSYGDVLLYENTEGRSAANPDGCDIRVSPGSFLFGNEWNVLEYDSKLGNVVWVESIEPEIVAPDPLKVTTVENLGKSAKLQIKNSSPNAAAFVSKLRIRGKAYIEVPGQTTRVPGAGKSKKYDIKYNHDQGSITKLTRKIADYYKYAKFTCEIKSDENYPLGSFVIVTEEAMGTIKGRIVRKTYRLREPTVYEIESIDDYTPVEDTNILKKASTKMNNILAVPPDLTPPTAPMIISSNVNTKGWIDVTFSKSADYDSGVSYYNVYRSAKDENTEQETPYVIVYSMAHNKDEETNTVTFTDNQTSNSVSYSYKVTAVDKANNESNPSNTLKVTSVVSASPRTPYLIKAEADPDGVNVLIFIPKNVDSSSFQDEITETVFFRLQNSYDNGVTWNELGRIQGNTFFWKYDSNFIVSVENLNKLKFRAFGWNMFNVENPSPIEMMNHQVKHNLAETPPPFSPPKEMFTELVEELIIRDEESTKYSSLGKDLNLPKGWYYVVCSAGGSGGSGGGGGGGGGTWGKGAGSTGGTGGPGGDGSNSFMTSRDDGVVITANGGKGPTGGAGGGGGSGGSLGVASGDGGYGEDGQDGQDGGYIETSFFKQKDDSDKTVSGSVVLKGTTLQAGGAGRGGGGGGGGRGR
jgi:hypothetical protein